MERLPHACEIIDNKITKSTPPGIACQWRGIDLILHVVDCAALICTPITKQGNRPSPRTRSVDLQSTPYSTVTGIAQIITTNHNNNGTSPLAIPVLREPVSRSSPDIYNRLVLIGN